MLHLLQYDPSFHSPAVSTAAGQGINGFGLDGWQAFGAFGAVMVLVALLGFLGIRSLLKAVTAQAEKREALFTQILTEERHENAELSRANIQLAGSATSAITRSNEVATQQIAAINDIRQAIALDNEATRQQIRQSESAIIAHINKRIPHKPREPG
jgi:hypothetical protein